MLRALLIAVSALAPQRDSLTLEQALALARRARPQLRVAEATRAEARAGVGAVSAIPNPVLQYKHTEGSPSDEAILEQRLDWMLTRWPDRNAAQAGLRGATADATRIAAELSREVRVAFYQARAALESLRLVTALGASADSLATFAAGRVVAGDISALEREQFAVEAGRVRQMVSRAAEAAALAGAALVRALGQESGEQPPAGPLDQGLDAPWPSAAGAGSVPALQRALADSAVEQARFRAATLRRLPFPSLRIGREWDDNGPFSNGATGILGFAVPLPLWNIGSGTAAVARARATRAAAAAGEARLETARLLAAGESRLRATRERALHSRDSLMPRAQRLSAGAQRLYRAGQTGVLPLFDALRAEREVALGYVQDLLAWQMALADWLALLGRTE